MTARLELTGQRFERLVAMRDAGSTNLGQRLWLCKCDCGNETIVAASKLKNGHTRSCGCLQRDRTTRHGMWKSSEYRSWQSMKARCSNKNNTAYEFYGGRGITMCQRWKDSFEAFYEDMGPRPGNLEVDRIDNDGGYWCGKCSECLSNERPANCRWATRSQQILNTRRSADGLARKCREHDMNRGTVKSRLEMGWTLEDALTTPVRDDSFPQMCRDHGLKVETVRARLKYGWTREKAFTTPVR